MPRPKVPLVSKRATLEAGLRIADGEGLNALTIRRLAQELNINGASLYHHFKNKDEILAGVAKLALEDVRTPAGAEEDWPTWLFRNIERYRDALKAHPALVPVLLRRHPLRIGLREHNATAALLAVQGVPGDVILPMLESLEALALGSVMYSSAVEADEHREEWAADYPHLYHLAGQAGFDWDETFEIVCKAAIDAFVHMAEGRSGDGNADEKAPARRKS